MVDYISELKQLKLESVDNWGPRKDFIFEEFKGLPFAPFNKLEKINLFCDIIVQGKGNSTNLTKAVEDEEDFTVVESRGIAKKLNQTQKKSTKKKPVQVRVQTQQGMPTSYKIPVGKQAKYYATKVYSAKTKFRESTSITTEWENIADISKQTVEKVIISNVSVQELEETGNLKHYDRNLDKVTPRTEKIIQPLDTLSIPLSTVQDTYLMDLVDAEHNNDTLKPTVYATDVYLSCIMTLKSSVFPWEISVTKEGNQIVFFQTENDIDDKYLSYIDLLTVNENTQGNMPEDEKMVQHLCKESTLANNEFQNFASSGKLLQIKGEKSSVSQGRNGLYRYRRWTVDGYDFVVRTQVDSYLETDLGEKKYLRLFALNEFDLTNEWRKKYEFNKGSLLSSEMRSNMNKISRWICESYLGGVTDLKIGLVSRTDAKDTKKHSLIGVETQNRKILEQTIGFKINEGWTYLKYIVEFLMSQEDGQYALIKPSYKQNIRVYKVHRGKDDEDIE